MPASWTSRAAGALREHGGESGGGGFGLSWVCGQKSFGAASTQRSRVVIFFRVEFSGGAAGRDAAFDLDAEHGRKAAERGSGHVDERRNAGLREHGQSLLRRGRQVGSDD